MPLAAESLDPPQPDEFEVSVFGPGVGECIAVHPGGGEWMIVDSLIDPGNERPVAADYLEGLGVDIATRVKALVASHWHDDHVRGMGWLLRRAAAARIYCSAALRRKEFYRAVEAARQTHDTESSGIAEFGRVFDILGERMPGARPEAIGPVWLSEGNLIWREAATSARPALEIQALSPSPATQTLALHGLAALLGEEGSPKRRVPSLDPNQTAVAVWVQAGACQALLGADLEASPRPEVGWKAVVASRSRPPGRAALFKVPHHGSANADEPAVWDEMLLPHPCALLTPFSRTPLPRASDVIRLLGRTPGLYCTASSEARRPAKRDPAVEKTLREVARDRRVLTGPMGHVRFRAPLSGGPGHVSLFSGAYKATA